MADQTEIKKVISVDLGNTATSLKDYKKHIDDLRGSLLQLDETSQEYAEISKEIKNEQDKLNEVMKAGKYDTDAAAGSYNNLTATMAELKKQWKATADEAERAELGKKILDINNQLKDLDAQTGNFQRNVGDYSNAFEQAFGKMLDGVNKIDGPIGELGGTVKNMIPVIKNINKTAVAGLTGVKKAIASTGIGLLVIAVGELITHWRELAKIVGISEDDIKSFKDSALDTFKNIVAGAVGVGNAIGNFLIAPIKVVIEEFRGLGNIIKDVFTGDFSKIKDDAMAALDAIKGIGRNAVDFAGNYQEGVDAAEKLMAVIKERLTEEGENTGEAAADAVVEGVNNGFRRAKIEPIPELKPESFEGRIEESFKAMKDRIKEQKQLLSDDLAQDKFEFSLVSDTMTEQEKLDEMFRIESGYIMNLIALNEEMLSNTEITEEEKRQILYETDKLRQELANKQAKYAKDTAEEEVKADEDAAKRKKQAWQSAAGSVASIFDSLSELMEEGSEEQKALQIMSTTINTLSGAISAYQSMASIPYVGPFLGAAAAAAVTAAGVANIAKIKSTNKNSSGNVGSVAAPNINAAQGMTEVSPLLNEQSDLNRMEMSGMQSGEQQNLRVYVVDQDIRDANARAEVVEDNATF